MHTNLLVQAQVTAGYFGLLVVALCFIRGFVTLGGPLSLGAYSQDPNV